MPVVSLMFNNPSFKDGINHAFRNGREWLNIKSGARVNLKNSNGDDLGVGRIIGMIPLEVDSIPEDWFEREQVSNTNELKELLDMLDGTVEQELTMISFELE